MLANRQIGTENASDVGEKAQEPVIGRFRPILFASKARSYGLVHGLFLPATYFNQRPGFASTVCPGTACNVANCGELSFGSSASAG